MSPDVLKTPPTINFIMLPCREQVIHKIILTSAVVCFWVLSATMAFGAEYTLTPGLKLQEAYNDKVLFEDIHDLETRISPSLGLLAKTERGSAKLTSNWDILRYRDNNDLDRVNQKHGLGLSYGLTPLVSLSLSAGVGIDYSFESELEESGIVAEKQKRNKYSLGPGISFSVNEFNSLRFSLSLSKTDNEKEDSTDNTGGGANLGWTHVWDEKTSLTASGGVRQTWYDYEDGDGHQRVYSVSGNMNRRFSEIFSMSLGGGGSKSYSHYDRRAGTTEGQTKQFNLNAGARWALEKTAFSCNVSRGLTQSIYDEDVTRDRLSGNVSYKFTERISSSLSSSYTRSKTEGIVQERKSETYFYSPSLQFKTGENSNLKFSYTYTESEDKIKDTSKHSNKYMIQYSISFPQNIN